MRRSSIVGPLILILIGGLFLANNLRPEFSVFTLIAEYWPFLLIAWGLARIAEILFWAMTKKPLPARGVSGGEWAVVILLAIVGSGMFEARRQWGWNPVRLRLHGIEMFGEAYDFNLEQRSVAAGKTPRVIIENLRGNVRVVGADTDNVTVSGRKTIRAFDQAAADQANQRTAIDVSDQGGMIVVRTNHERGGSEQRIHSDLEVTVPRGASLECRGRRGDFDISEVAGAVEVQSDNAGVRIQNVAGSVRTDVRRSDIIRVVNAKGEVAVRGQSDNLELESIEGQVIVDGSYFQISMRNLKMPVKFDGTATDFRAERVPGEIRMSPTLFSAENVIGPLYMQTTRSKGVEITDVTQGVELQLDRGDVQIITSRMPLPKLDIRTRRGDISVSVPEQAKFGIRAQTDNGDVQNDYGGTLTQNRSGRRAELLGRTGDGPEFQLTTGNGLIVLRRTSPDLVSRAAEPEPPPPPPPRAPRPRPDLSVEKN